MLINRPNMIYQNGLLAVQYRERVSNVPLRYKRTWTVRRVIELEPHQVDLYDRHSVILDDTGAEVIYTCVETVGAELSKHQVNVLLRSTSEQKDRLTEAPPQPAVRLGETLSLDGRWNHAALKALHQVTDQEMVWTKGPLGQGLSMGGIAVARISRPLHSGEGRPWIVRIKGYERWHEPTRIIRHWHHTAAWSAPSLIKAKRAIEQVIRSAPDPE